MSNLKVRMYGISTNVQSEFMDKPYFTYGFPFPAPDDDTAKQMVIASIAQGAIGRERECYHLVCFGEFYPERPRLPFAVYRKPEIISCVADFVTDDVLENFKQKEVVPTDDEKNI